MEKLGGEEYDQNIVHKNLKIPNSPLLPPPPKQNKILKNQKDRKLGVALGVNQVE